MASKEAARSFSFRVLVVDVQNIPLDPGQGVQVKWSCGRKQGTSSVVQVDKNKVASYNYDIFLNSVKLEGGKPPFLTLCLEHVSQVSRMPVMLDKLSMQLNPDSSTTRVGICSSKRIIFTVQLSLDQGQGSRGMDGDCPSVIELEKQLREVQLQLQMERQSSTIELARMRSMMPSVEDSSDSFPDIPFAATSSPPTLSPLRSKSKSFGYTSDSDDKFSPPSRPLVSPVRRLENLRTRSANRRTANSSSSPLTKESGGYRRRSDIVHESTPPDDSGTCNLCEGGCTTM